MLCGGVGLKETPFLQTKILVFLQFANTTRLFQKPRNGSRGCDVPFFPTSTLTPTTNHLPFSFNNSTNVFVPHCAIFSPQCATNGCNSESIGCARFLTSLQFLVFETISTTFQTFIVLQISKVTIICSCHVFVQNVTKEQHTKQRKHCEKKTQFHRKKTNQRKSKEIRQKCCFPSTHGVSHEKHACLVPLQCGCCGEWKVK